MDQINYPDYRATVIEEEYISTKNKIPEWVEENEFVYPE